LALELGSESSRLGLPAFALELKLVLAGELLLQRGDAGSGLEESVGLGRVDRSERALERGIASLDSVELGRERESEEGSAAGGVEGGGAEVGGTGRERFATEFGDGRSLLERAVREGESLVVVG
jgi:hypothetical protein